LAATISRVTGNALKPAELIAPAAGIDGTPETQHRAEVSFRVGSEALQQLAAPRPGASLTVLYVTDGYDTRRVGGLHTLIDAANSRRASLRTLAEKTGGYVSVIGQKTSVRQLAGSGCSAGSVMYDSHGAPAARTPRSCIQRSIAA
jgi:hypothetical protein